MIYQHCTHKRTAHLLRLLQLARQKIFLILVRPQNDVLLLKIPLLLIYPYGLAIWHFRHPNKATDLLQKVARLELAAVGITAPHLLRVQWSLADLIAHAKELKTLEMSYNEKMPNDQNSPTAAGNKGKWLVLP